jgi:hypothetical protein
MQKHTKLVVALVLFCSTVFTWAESVDLEKSKIAWEGGKVFTDSKHWGTVSIKSGSMSLESGNLHSGNLVFDMNSIVNEDVKGEWNAKLVGHLKSEDFFEVAKYPTSTVTVTKSSVSGNTAQVEADLTVKDQTHPITFIAERKGDKIVGNVTFDRTQWGVQYGAKSTFSVSDLAGKAKDKVIKDEISINFELAVK